MKNKKPCGYYWRVLNKIKKSHHDYDVVYLEDYPIKAQTIIIHGCMKYLPMIVLQTTRERKKKKKIILL